MTDTPDTETGAAFAAGVATAEAEQAQREASSAAVRAEIAEERAEGAERAAGDAIEQSWATRAAVDDLAAEMRNHINEIRELITSKDDGAGRPSRGDAATGAGAVPAPERKEETPAPVVEDDADKSKRRSGYGSHAWFGKQ